MRPYVLLSSLLHFGTDTHQMEEGVSLSIFSLAAPDQFSLKKSYIITIPKSEAFQWCYLHTPLCGLSPSKV
jgi:hypothetical protein